MVLDGKQYSKVALIIVRTSGQVHALWARGNGNGCKIVPYHGQVSVDAAFRSEVSVDGPSLRWGQAHRRW